MKNIILILWTGLVLSQAMGLHNNRLIAQKHFTTFNYRPSNYLADNQNWDISRDSKGRVFVANNAGLLMYDGSQIQLLELPKSTIVRSVKCLGSRVYTGSFEEFGYWEEESDGSWTYYSLVHLVEKDVFRNDEFWKIVELNESIYFQSFGNILHYNGHEVEALELPGSVLFLLKSADRVFIQQINGGIFELHDNELNLIPGSEIFSATEVKSIVQLTETDFIIATSSMGLFKYSSSKFEPWPNEINENLKAYKINHGIVLGDKLVFGTILKGLFLLDTNGRLIHHLHSTNALQNNTVLALAGDDEKNLWVGLDKGFDYIWFHSPIETYKYPGVDFGTVYTAAMYENELYIGTNQGVYCFRADETGKYYDPQLIDQSQGQVWFIRVLEGKLYCGLNDGTYLIHNHQLTRVSNMTGGFNLNKAIINDHEMYLQSTYNEIVVFEKEHGVFMQQRILDGFSAPARFLEADFLGNLLLGHAISGLYLIQPSANFDSVIQYTRLGPDHGLHFNTNKLFKVDNRIIVSSGKKMYQWDALKQMLVPYDELNAQLERFTSATTIITAGNNKYWFIKKEELGLFEIRYGVANLLYSIIPEMYDIELFSDFENIIELPGDQFLICLVDGFAILDIMRLDQLAEINTPPKFEEIAFRNQAEKQVKAFSKTTSKPINIKHSYNNFLVRFSSHETVGRKKYFQYRLTGLEEEWSDWSDQTKAVFTRLPPGNYTFQVRSLTARGKLTAAATVPFRIHPPVLLSWYAFAVYIILIIVFIILLRSNYKKRKWRKQEQMLKEEYQRIKLRNEQAEAEIIKLANEKLQTEVALKNMELAKNTMSTIHNKEMLSHIKTELEALMSDLKTKIDPAHFDRIIKLINSNYSGEKDWEMFEYLFDQAHHGFFKRLKESYPHLTPHDYRLCAYLRLNLTSKEIAPLLNISVRGVEEKRYRLRKRMNLQTDQNLTEFLIEF